MARQEQIFAQTISDMKRAMLRKADDSESDDLIEKPTNRGNKLKRKANFVEEGRLDLANSVQAHRKKINYNGYFREIISKNPKRVDQDGDVVDEEDDDSSAEVEDLEEDPYSEVKIERLLMPLTSAAELKTHPSLSIPYKAKILDEMIKNAQDMLFREEDALWRMRKLADEFRGDSTWMPAGNFENANDIFLLGPANAGASAAASVVQDGEVPAYESTTWDSMSNAQLMQDLEEAAENGANHGNIPGVSVVDMESAARHVPNTANIEKEHLSPTEERQDVSPQDDTQTQQADVPMAEATGQPLEEVSNGKGSEINGTNETVPAKEEPNTAQETEGSTEAKPVNEGGDTSGLPDENKQQGEQPEAQQKINGENGEDEENTKDEQGEDAGEDEEAAHPPHRMTTRAKAQAATSPNSNDQEASSPLAPFIHPFFLPPETALSTKEVGLPFDEADETRRLVCAYAQKQEEVCRGAARLYHGLLRARRMRDSVLEWCNAEGHIGEMSDGEDWYDREKWGLTEDLKKGEELDEEEANVTGKTRRHRRTARDA